MTYAKKAQENGAEYAALKASSPGVLGAFSQLHQANGKDGALSAKQKELIALGIGIVKHCEGCIISHVNTLIKLQVTRDEVIEVINTAIMMDGGPSTIYGSKALACFDEISGA